MAMGITDWLGQAKIKRPLFIEELFLGLDAEDFTNKHVMAPQRLNLLNSALDINGAFL